MSREEIILYLFKAYLVDKKDNIFIPNIEALKKGILINQNCNKKIIDLAIKLWGKDGYILNQTFHKSIDTVINTSTEDLIIEQIIHYFTTYGFESLGIYDKDRVYIPKEKLEVPELNNEFTFINIKSITKAELSNKLWNIVTSSIALSKKSINCIINLSDYLEINSDNIDKINNREIKVALYEKLKIVPKNNIEFLRYLIYILTNKTILIKDKKTIEYLEKSNKSKALKLIKKYNDLYSLIPLAEIFNRFKPLFLALKTENSFYFNEKNEKIMAKNNVLTREQKELNKIINKISKLSKRYHKPFKINNLDRFVVWYKDNVDKENYMDLLNVSLNKESIWRIIKLRNYVSLINSDINERLYKIRNGKSWVTRKNQKVKIDKETINMFDEIIIKKLESNVLSKRIYLDNNVDLALPQSEKQFVGNIPFSSCIEIDKDNLLIGIHWFNVKDERVDLDLKIISNEYSIGWDCNYKEDDKLVFTGDMTDAPYPNGASEYIYIDKKIGNGTFSLKVNNFTRDVDKITYDIIIAKKSKKELAENYIVDPNDIIIKIPNNTIEIGQAEHALGNIIIRDKKIKIVFSDLSTSNKRTACNTDIEEILREYLVCENNTKCKLKDYLKKSGAIITHNRKNIDLDLGINSLNKDSIINLLK